MFCHNCGNRDRFVLSVELAATVRPGGDGTVRPGGDVTAPAWSVGLACEQCASTHVAGDPLRLLRRR